jgi:hypothetical protein
MNTGKSLGVLTSPAREQQLGENESIYSGIWTGLKRTSWMQSEFRQTQFNPTDKTNQSSLFKYWKLRFPIGLRLRIVKSNAVQRYLARQTGYCEYREVKKWFCKMDKGLKPK